MLKSNVTFSGIRRDDTVKNHVVEVITVQYEDRTGPVKTPPISDFPMDGNNESAL